MNHKRMRRIAFCAAMLLCAMPILSHADGLKPLRVFPKVSVESMESRLPIGSPFTLKAQAENLKGTETVTYKWQYSMKHLAAIGIWYDVTAETNWCTDSKDGNLTVSSEFTNSYQVISQQDGPDATVFRCLVTVDGKM